MNAPHKPVVTVVHSLPGRVRLRFSRPPTNPCQLAAGIQQHPGMGSIQYSQATRSLLIHFDPHNIQQEEITLRVAFQFSLDQDGQPVRLLAMPESVVLDNSAVLAAIALAVTFGRHWLHGGKDFSPTRWDWVAGLGTAWAITLHAWKELRHRGYVDPEVLSLAYLLSALARGKFRTASAVTWLSTFGRHLLEVPPTGVEVRPVEVSAPTGQGPRYELMVSPDHETPEKLRVLGALQGILKYAMSGGGAHGVHSLWEELRDVSRIHGEILEGYGRMSAGIPVRFGR
jgi:hypothetical protein